MIGAGQWEHDRREVQCTAHISDLQTPAALAVNKWDLVKDDGRGEAAVQELSALLDCEEDEILRISAKTGMGVEAVLEAVVDRIPPPQPYNPQEKLRALAFDSYYDSFRGVVSLVAVFEGELKKGKGSVRVARRYAPEPSS